MVVEKLCREEEVGFVDLWGSFVGRADMYMKDWLHLSRKRAAHYKDDKEQNRISYTANSDVQFTRGDKAEILW